MIYNQIVTWTAFTILAMFLVISESKPRLRKSIVVSIETRDLERIHSLKKYRSSIIKFFETRVLRFFYLSGQKVVFLRSKTNISGSLGAPDSHPPSPYLGTIRKKSSAKKLSRKKIPKKRSFLVPKISVNLDRYRKKLKISIELKISITQGWSKRVKSRHFFIHDKSVFLEQT